MVQEGPAIAGEGEGDAVLPLWTPTIDLQFCFDAWLEVLAIAFSLGHLACHIGVGPLGLHGRIRSQANKQHVISWTAAGGPFGDGLVAVLLRPGSFPMAKGLRIRLPARLPQLLIDQLACGGLIQFDRTSCLLGCLQQSGRHRCRLTGGGALKGLQLSREGNLVRLSSFGQMLPLLLLIECLLQLGLRGAELLGHDSSLGAEGIERTLQGGQLRA